MAWHWFPEGQENIVAQLRRATVQKVDDDGTQQMLKKMTGLKKETFEDVYRPQMHGFSSHPPSGSEGMFLALGGRSDRLLALGFEHKDYRPKKTPEGDAMLYNHSGDVIRVFKKAVDVVHTAKINLAIGKGVGESEDDVSIVMTKNDITIKKADTSIKIEAAKVTVTSPHVIVKSDKVDLGGEGGPAVLTEGGPSSKVFAIL